MTRALCHFRSPKQTEICYSFMPRISVYDSLSKAGSTYDPQVKFSLLPVFILPQSEESCLHFKWLKKSKEVKIMQNSNVSVRISRFFGAELCSIIYELSTGFCPETAELTASVWPTKPNILNIRPVTEKLANPCSKT